MSLRRTANMQEKQEKILECALELFAEKGYVNTRVRDIIDRSGFGTGTFYKYFDSQEKVLTELLSEFLDEIIESVTEFFKTEEDLFIRFIESKRFILEVFVRNEKMAEIYSRVRGLGSNVDQCLKDFDDRLILFMSKNNQYGIDNGVFCDLPVLPIAYSTLAIINYAVYKWVVMKDISAEEMVSLVLSFHRSLALGLLNADYLAQNPGKYPRMEEEANRCAWPKSIWQQDPTGIQ
ncbi:MAG: TetR/AcrR family transcriptional regulator [Syntrophomonadaceae bacterium]